MRSQVKAVKLRRDRIAVVLETKIYVYNFYDLKLRDKIHTVPNPKGLCCLSSDPNSLVLASPDNKKGTVLVKHYHHDTSLSISMFPTSIACVALSFDGSLVAAACERGTIIKVYSTTDGSVLKEFGRGIDRAVIESLSFHPSSEWLACSSDSGTVHIFGLRRSG